MRVCVCVCLNQTTPDDHLYVLVCLHLSLFNIYYRAFQTAIALSPPTAVWRKSKEPVQTVCGLLLCRSASSVTLTEEVHQRYRESFFLKTKRKHAYS